MGKTKKRQKQGSQSKVDSNTLDKRRKANSKEMGILGIITFINFVGERTS